MSKKSPKKVPVEKKLIPEENPKKPETSPGDVAEKGEKETPERKRPPEGSFRKIETLNKEIPGELAKETEKRPPGEKRSQEGSFRKIETLNEVPWETTEEEPWQPLVGKEPTFAPDRRLKRVRKWNWRHALAATAAVIAFALVIIMPATHYYREGFDLGVREGLREARERITREGVKWPADLTAKVDAAMIELRRGDPAAALKHLREVAAVKPDISSLSYLIALAAMQSGDIDLAEQNAQESIEKQERVSDSLALLSVLAVQKGVDKSRPHMGDPGLRAEAFLRQAILADIANPYPRYELATLLRYQGRDADALHEIESAQARLNPVDSHLVMDVTLAIMRMEKLPVADLPAEAPASDDVRKLLPAAYAAMRRENFAQAAALLEKCRKELPPDIFDYLIYDPALKRYKSRPELRAIYGP